VPSFGPDAYVYEPYLLLRSHLILQGRTDLTLPAETEALIEGVYGNAGQMPTTADLPPALATALEEAFREMQSHRDEEQQQARLRLIPPPDHQRLMDASEVWLEEGKPELHRALQALTRFIPPGMPLVCLHRTEQGLTLEPDGSGPVIDLAHLPTPELTRQIAQYTINVTHRPAVDHFVQQPVPDGWQDHPLLHDHRVAIFHNGACRLGGKPYTLRLSRELGLEIEKEA